MRFTIVVFMFLLVAGLSWSQGAPTFSQEGNATTGLRAAGVSVAHPSLPIGSRVMVRNAATGAEVEATIAGRILASTERIVDLSPAAAQAIGLSAGGPVHLYIPDRTAPAIAAAPPRPVEPEPIPEPRPEPRREPKPEPVAAQQPINITIHANIINPAPEAKPEPKQVQPIRQPEPAWMCNLATPRPNVSVVPAMPNPRSGRIHTLQVGSYTLSTSANALLQEVRRAGFTASIERWQNLHRIVVTGIPSCQVAAAVHCLGSIGIREVWVRD